MPPIALHDLNNKLSVIESRFEAMEDRAIRVDRHIEATDARVEELRTFMIQVKAIGIAVGIIWPLVVKYLLPK